MLICHRASPMVRGGPSRVTTNANANDATAVSQRPHLRPQQPPPTDAAAVPPAPSDAFAAPPSHPDAAATALILTDPAAAAAPRVRSTAPVVGGCSGLQPPSVYLTEATRTFFLTPPRPLRRASSPWPSSSAVPASCRRGCY